MRNFLILSLTEGGVNRYNKNAYGQSDYKCFRSEGGVVVKRNLKYVLGAIIGAAAVALIVPFAGITAKADGQGVKIDEINFPSEELRNYAFDSDSNVDGYLSEEEAQSVTIIVITTVTEENSSLKGIEYFKNLKSLSVDGGWGLGYKGQLTAIDLSNNTKLESLLLRDNPIKTLDLSRNTQLKSVICVGNELTSLNVSGCTKLEELWVIGNALSTLDISNCTTLLKRMNGEKVTKSWGANQETIMYSEFPYDFLWYDATTTLITTQNVTFVNGQYYNNGVPVPSKFGFVDFNGSKFLVANGVIAKNKSGLVQDPDNTSDWYFCASGQVVTNKTGIINYNGTAFYVSNGKLDTSVNGYFQFGTGLFFVSKGRVVKTANGLVQDPNNKADWYFCANGQVQLKKTGVVIYNKAGFYVVNGKLDTSYNGNATYNGKTVKIVNGRMQ